MYVNRYRGPLLRTRAPKLGMRGLGMYVRKRSGLGDDTPIINGDISLFPDGIPPITGGVLVNTKRINADGNDAFFSAAMSPNLATDSQGSLINTAAFNAAVSTLNTDPALQTVFNQSMIDAGGTAASAAPSLATSISSFLSAPIVKGSNIPTGLVVGGGAFLLLMTAIGGKKRR